MLRTCNFEGPCVGKEPLGPLSGLRILLRSCLSISGREGVSTSAGRCSVLRLGLVRDLNLVITISSNGEQTGG
jgi:hypothetical protein